MSAPCRALAPPMGGLGGLGHRRRTGPDRCGCCGSQERAEHLRRQPRPVDPGFHDRRQELHRRFHGCRCEVPEQADGHLSAVILHIKQRPLTISSAGAVRFAFYSRPSSSIRRTSCRLAHSAVYRRRISSSGWARSGTITVTKPPAAPARTPL